MSEPRAVAAWQGPISAVHRSRCLRPLRLACSERLRAGAAKMDIGPDRRGKRDRAADPLVIPFQQFFATAVVPCPYVPGRDERKLIVELAGRAAPAFYDELSRAGFRRSHRFAYRPACRSCAACVPVRIAVERFAHTRSTRRVRNLNGGAPNGGNGALA